jgi:hypothetical protein
MGERTGGRHRASGLTELLARELRAHGRQVDVGHLHVHLPRVLEAADTSTGAGALWVRSYARGKTTLTAAAAKRGRP